MNGVNQTNPGYTEAALAMLHGRKIKTYVGNFLYDGWLYAGRFFFHHRENGYLHSIEYDPTNLLEECDGSGEVE